MNNKNKVVLADRLRVTLSAAIVFCGMLAAGKNKAVFIVVELIMLVLLLLAEFSLNRCPHCDRYLDRNRGQFCQHCGQRIREERPDT